MKDAILLELARRWENESNTESVMPETNADTLNGAKNQGRRETLRECADAIESLVHLLGDV